MIIPINGSVHRQLQFIKVFEVGEQAKKLGSKQGYRQAREQEQMKEEEENRTKKKRDREIERERERTMPARDQ